jgi:hypothetical protein
VFFLNKFQTFMFLKYFIFNQHIVIVHIFEVIECNISIPVYNGWWSGQIRIIGICHPSCLSLLVNYLLIATNILFILNYIAFYVIKKIYTFLAFKKISFFICI